MSDSLQPYGPQHARLRMTEVAGIIECLHVLDTLLFYIISSYAYKIDAIINLTLQLRKQTLKS